MTPLGCRPCFTHLLLPRSLLLSWKTSYPELGTDSRSAPLGAHLQCLFTATTADFFKKVIDEVQPKGKWNNLGRCKTPTTCEQVALILSYCPFPVWNTSFLFLLCHRVAAGGRSAGHFSEEIITFHLAALCATLSCKARKPISHSQAGCYTKEDLHPALARTLPWAIYPQAKLFWMFPS